MALDLELVRRGLVVAPVSWPAGLISWQGVDQVQRRLQNRAALRQFGWAGADILDDGH